MTPDPVYVLWTGGWDSTFRVLDLTLRQRRAVVPVYVLGRERRSTDAELATMEMIRSRLATRDPTAASLLAATRLIQKLEADDDYKEAWDRIRRNHFLGSQYHWLPRSLNAAGFPITELCIHRDDKAAAVIGDRVVYESNCIQVDAESGSDLHSLFARFRLPLFDLTKLEMESAALAAGFVDIMEISWFCHNPTSAGRPCGACNPCRYTRQEGLGRRVPRAYGRRLGRASWALLIKGFGFARPTVRKVRAITCTRKRASPKRMGIL